MAEGTGHVDPRHETSLTINATSNFADGLLSEGDITLIHDAVSPGDLGTMAALNAGIPMRPYVLKSLLTIRVKHRYSKIRNILEPLIAFAVSVSHFQNTRRILRESVAKRAHLFDQTTIDRIEAGLHRTYRAIGSPDNPYDLIEAIQDTDLPKGAYESHVRHLYSLLEKINFDLRTTANLDYTRLAAFNYLFDSPKFTDQEAIDMYADNLANITRRSPNPLRCLTASRQSRDPFDVINDCMFALAMGNAIVYHQDSVRLLHRTLIMEATALCSSFYATYLQVPETKNVYAAMARECFRLSTMTGPDPVHYNRLLALMFQFVRAIAAADVYACPGYMLQQIFSVSGRMHGYQSPMFGHSGDLDMEIDPSSPYQASYHVNNPFTDSNLFRCPKDIVSHLGPNMFEKKITSEVFTNCTDTTLSTQIVETDMVRTLLSEGVARVLKIQAHHVDNYLDTVSTPADILTPNDLDVDLFADVYVEPDRTPASDTGRPPRSTRFINVKGAKPYPVDRQ